MALSADKPRSFDPAVDPMFADLPVTASATVYQGAAVTDDGSAGRVDGAMTASESFLGFTDEAATGGSSDGDVRVRVRQKGIIKDLAVTGLDAITDIGAAVYATDNDTFTLTSSTTYVQIGKVQMYKGTSGYGDVYFEGAIARSI